MRAKLKNLTRIDIKMQAEVRSRSASRFLYYWAREFGLGLKREDHYNLLVPVTSIIWLGKDWLVPKRSSSSYRRRTLS